MVMTRLPALPVGVTVALTVWPLSLSTSEPFLTPNPYSVNTAPMLVVSSTACVLSAGVIDVSSMKVAAARSVTKPTSEAVLPNTIECGPHPLQPDCPGAATEPSFTHRPTPIFKPAWYLRQPKEHAGSFNS